MTKFNAIESSAGNVSEMRSMPGSAETVTPWLGICARLSGAAGAGLPSECEIRSSVVRRHVRTMPPELGTPMSASEVDVLDDLDDMRFSWERD
jgi:hypothetical protein